MTDDVQQLHKLAKAVDSGEDENGPYEMIPISMVRGGKLSPVKVHTRPMKHLMKDTTPAPRGWYKPKSPESDRVRARPCYTEALLTTPYGGFCPINCAHCVSGDTLVNTVEGLCRIDNMVVGTTILGLNGLGKLTESIVLAVTRRVVDSYYVLETLDGAILNITGDHPIYAVGRGWVPVQDLEVGDETTLSRLRSIVDIEKRFRGNVVYGLPVQEEKEECEAMRSYSETQRRRWQEKGEVLQGLRCGHRESHPLEGILRHLPFEAQTDYCGALQRNSAQEISQEGCCQEMRALWGTSQQSHQEVMRCMPSGASGRTRSEEQRQTFTFEGKAAVVEEGKASYIEKDDGKQECRGLHSICGVACRYGGAHGEGSQNGLQSRQAGQIHAPGWAQDKLQINMGEVDSKAPGFCGGELGIRGHSVYFRGFWRSIFARLYGICGGWLTQENHRGEGLLSSRESKEDGAFSQGFEGRTGVGFGGLGREGVEETWHTRLTRLERVDEPLEVWDIQTSTENFFANGLLVHNCYVNNGTRGYRATGLPVAHYKYPQAMKTWVSKLMVTGAAYITSFSEPFHPLEDTYHITKDLTQVFLDEGLPIFYLSRKIPPDWAMDALLENPYSYMQWSINTSNPDHYRKFSPGSFTLDEVYKAIQRFHDNGIFISIQVNPIIAGVSTLQEIVDLVYELEAVGANHVIFKFVEQVANNRQVIVDRMHQRGLPHVDVFDNLFSQVIGGVYTIQEDVRIEWLDALLAATRDAQITMSLCYEYWDDGFAGENLAPYYTTADQCHGRGVPIYFRREPGAAFEPLAGCYRKGCLYCLEHGTQACDNDKLLEAGALTYADLRSIRVARINEPSWWTLGDSCASPQLAGAHMQGRIFGNPDLQTDAEMWDWAEDDNPEDIACGWE